MLNILENVALTDILIKTYIKELLDKNWGMVITFSFFIAYINFWNFQIYFGLIFISFKEYPG